MHSIDQRTTHLSKFTEDVHFENEYLKKELMAINHNFIPKYEQVITDLQNQNEFLKAKIDEIENKNGWDHQSEKMLAEMHKMQEAIEYVKQENENLKEEKYIYNDKKSLEIKMYRDQLVTLKNVNESQQKLINFMQDSKDNNASFSPSFYNKIDDSHSLMYRNDANYSPISEDENEYESTGKQHENLLFNHDQSRGSNDDSDLSGN